jgi:hypothetical protein
VPPDEGQATGPTISKNKKDEANATVADLPDVSQLPEPEKAKEET